MSLLWWVQRREEEGRCDWVSDVTDRPGILFGQIALFRSLVDGALWGRKELELTWNVSVSNSASTDSPENRATCYPSHVKGRGAGQHWFGWQADLFFDTACQAVVCACSCTGLVIVMFWWVCWFSLIITGTVLWHFCVYLTTHLELFSALCASTRRAV